MTRKAVKYDTGKTGAEARAGRSRRPWRRRIAAIALTAAWVVAVPSGAAELWSVEARPGESVVGFTLDATLHQVRGEARLLRGELLLDPAAATATGRFVIDATSLDTGNKGRDEDMHRKVLESAIYPEIVFIAASYSGDFGADGDFELELAGTIEIHGESHPLSLPVRGLKSGDTVEATTSFVVPYVEWGMKDPSKFVLRVAKEVEVTIELVAAARRGTDDAAPAAH